MQIFVLLFSVACCFLHAGTHSITAVRQEMVMSAINFLEERLDTSDVMKKALVLEPQKAADALERMGKQSFLQVYGKPEIESLLDECMPDLDKGDAMSGWIAEKEFLARMADLGEHTLLSVLPKLRQLQKQNCLDAGDCLQLIARIVVVSPHSMYVERVISA